MGCPVDRDGPERIVFYGARRLAPDEQAEFELHVRTCARCRELAEEQRAVWSALDEWPAVMPSVNFDETLYQRIAMFERRSRWRGLVPDSRLWRSAVPVALACGALIAAFLLEGAARPSTPHRRIHAHVSRQAPKGIEPPVSGTPPPL